MKKTANSLRLDIILETAKRIRMEKIMTRYAKKLNNQSDVNEKEIQKFVLYKAKYYNIATRIELLNRELTEIKLQENVNQN